MSERDIFTGALKITDPAEQAAYLDRACAGDPELRQRVQMLLGIHGSAGDFLERPAAEQLAAVPEPADATQAFDALKDRKGPALSRTDGEGPGDEEPDDLSFLQPATRPDSLGRIGHYELLQVLGKGGFGIVFRAFDDVLHRIVAVKVMSPLLASTSPARKRFLREARSSAQVRHENVVQVYEIGEQPLPYIAMEFIPGETLQQRLDRVGPVEAAEVVRIGWQIAEGLAAAHATDLIHRDIKPGNVLLEGGAQRVKITDFGLARAADDASLSQSGIIAGTPMYMAPEQARGETLDQRADLFSLGSVLYQMCAGRPPFRASGTLAVLKRVAEDTPRPIREIIPETPPWLCDIIGKLHAKNPDERFQSAREVADVLADCEAQLKANARLRDFSRIPQSKSPAPSAGWRKWIAAAALLLPILAVVLTVIYWPRLIEIVAPHGIGEKVPVLVPVAKTPLATVDDAWVKRVAALPAEQQVDAVSGKLKNLNPGFDGKVGHKIEDGVVTELKIVTDQVTNISPIQVFSSLRVLDCSGTVPPDYRGKGQLADLTPLKDMNLKGLMELYLHCTRVGDAGLAYFEDCKNLIQLNLGGTMVSDAGLAHFKNSKNLTSLGLAYTQVSDTGLARFENCKNLTVLSLDGTKVSDAGLVHFKDCKGLTNLYLSNMTQITGAGLIHFKDCKNLTALGLNTTKVSDPGLAHFDGCNNLATLDLAGTQVSDAGLAHFKDCKHLTFLHLAHTQVSDAGLAHFKDCKNLTALGLPATQVSDAGLGHLKDCKDLTRLDLRITKVTPAKIAELKKALPNCKIEWDGTPAKVDTQPFVVLDAKSKKESNYTTLADAVAEAANGDIIEIRGNGPFELAPITLSKALTIRAGKDARPVLVHTTDGYLFRTTAPLVLEGLEIRSLGRKQDHAKGQFGMIEPKGTTLRIAHCRIVVTGELQVVHGKLSPSIELHHSQFHALWSAVSWDPPENGRLFIDKCVASVWCLFSIEHRANVLGIKKLSVDLTDNTVVAKTALSMSRFFKEREYGAEVFPSHRLRYRAIGNVFHLDQTFHYAQNMDGLPTARALADWQRENITWDHRQNLYTVNGHFLTLVTEVNGKLESDCHTLKDWQTFCKLKESPGIEAAPQFSGGNLLERMQKDPLAIVPADYRLAKGSPGQGAGPGGKDLGADVDRVGPGEPYEKWKQTTEYQRWLLASPGPVGEFRRFEGHTGAVISVALSADATRALSGSHDGTVRLWDTVTGKELLKLDAAAGWCEAVAFSPDASHALAGYSDGRVRLWDLKEAKEVKRFEGHVGGVRNVAFSPDGTRALSASGDRTVRLWEVRSGKELHCMKGHVGPLSCVAFSPDGKRALTGDSSYTGEKFDDTIAVTMRLWDLETGKELKAFKGPRDAFTACASLPDGRRALSSGIGDIAQVVLWDLDKGEDVRLFNDEKGSSLAVSVSKDGKRAVSSGLDGIVRLWDVVAARELRQFKGHGGHVQTVALSSDGRYALSGGDSTNTPRDNTMRLWRMPDLSAAGPAAPASGQ